MSTFKKDMHGKLLMHDPVNKTYLVLETDENTTLYDHKENHLMCKSQWHDLY